MTKELRNGASGNPVEEKKTTALECETRTVIYLTPEDDVTILPMSVRLRNAIHNADIRTIGAFLSFRQDHGFDSIRNLGAKSIEEAENLIRTMTQTGGGYCLISKAEFDRMLPSMSPVAKLARTPVSDLRLSERAKVFLRACGITNAAQLINITGESVQSLAGVPVPRKIIKEITSFAQDMMNNRELYPIDEKTALIHTLASELDSLLGVDMQEALGVLHDMDAANNDTHSESFISRLAEHPAVRTAIKRRIIKLVEENDRGVTVREAMASLPDWMQFTKLMDGFLLELERDGEILIERDEIIRVYPSVLDVVNSISDEKQRDFLTRRIHGQTLEEVGQVYGITRERVRQITNRALQVIHGMQASGQLPKRFNEDKYAYVFNRYLFTADDFQFAFGEPQTTFYYLEIVTPTKKAAKQPLEHALEDITLSIHTRRQIERIVYRHCISVDGMRVTKQRHELLRHYIKAHCRESTDFDVFYSNFRAWLETLGLPAEEFMPEYGSCKNRLASSDYVLWSHGSRFRYYDIEAHDYEQLLSCIDLEGYEKVVLSTLKWFRDNPEVMVSYDIRDEYELHNLLKKILADNTAVTFGKMPTVVIGGGNQDDQMLEMLLMYAPIEANALAQKYEEQFGVKAGTVLPSFIQRFSEYYFDGVFSIDAANLPHEEFSRMQEILTEDYYMIAQVKQIYLREFPDSDAGMINPYTLKTLGFRVYAGYEGYIIKNTYPNAVAYFQHILSGDMIDCALLNSGLSYNMVFNSTLSSFRTSRKLVEYEPRKYISANKLKKQGITASRIEDFCASVNRFVNEGAFFTIKSLIRNGFTSALFDEYDFDVWFYGSLLCESREQFSSLRFGGTYVFRKGKEAFSFSDFLYRIVESWKKISIRELTNHLIEHYGIAARKDKIIHLVKYSTDLYFDEITATVYISYEAYRESENITEQPE